MQIQLTRKERGREKTKDGEIGVEIQYKSLLSSAGTNAGSEVGCLGLQTRANSVPINNTRLRGNERKSLYNRCRNIGGLNRPAGLWRWFGGNVRGILRIVQLHGMDTEKAWRSR